MSDTHRFGGICHRFRLSLFFLGIKRILNAKSPIHTLHRFSNRSGVIQISLHHLNTLTAQRLYGLFVGIAHQRPYLPTVCQHMFGNCAALFSGCAENQNSFCRCFHHVLLLTSESFKRRISVPLVCWKDKGLFPCTSVSTLLSQFT